MNLFRSKKESKAFTLIELLVVVSTIAMLASIVLASVKTAQAKARDSRRTSDLTQFKNALELHALDNDQKYPPVPVNVAFTSKGPVSTLSLTAGEPIPCGPGSDWTSGSVATNEAVAFKENMKQYIASLPKDPLNDSSHCYIYSSDIGSSSGEQPDIATAYAEFETGTLASQPSGIIVGNLVNLPNLTANKIPPLALVIGTGTSSAAVASSTYPSVTTSGASSVSDTSAVLRGNITNTGGSNITVRGFQYGTSGSYGQTISESGSFGTGIYTLNATSLTCDTVYHFRATATRGNVTSYGSDNTFVTGTCTTPFAGKYGVTSNGFVVADTGDFEVHYSPTGNLSGASITLIPEGFTYDPTTNTPHFTLPNEIASSTWYYPTNVGETRTHSLNLGAVVEVKNMGYLNP